MLSKLSVKKPLTIFVAVIMVLVLGVVSFMKMTPDLLPNLDLPYAVIVTPYAGQTPETVETVVTKPLESAVSVIDGVKRITSDSAENYSMLLIEFEDGTNMDTAVIDVRSSLDTISDAWDDAVGSPYLIKANPNILPVAMIAVDYGGKERQEISDFVSDELMNRLEGIDGVASVSDKGIVTERESVIISQKKLDALNKKINAALDTKFADAEDKISEARAELDNNIALAQKGSRTISDSIDDVNEAQEQLAEKLSGAQKEASDGGSKILTAQMKLLDQKAALLQNKTTLETLYKTLLSVKTTYSELVEKKTGLESTSQVLSGLGERYTQVKETLKNAEATDEQIAAAKAELEKIEEELEPYGIKADDIAQGLSDANESLKTVNASINEVEAKLGELGTSVEKLDGTLGEMSAQISAIDDGVEQIDKAVEGLEDNTVTVNDALATISQQQSSSDFKLSGTVAALNAKQSELNSTAAQLSAAKSELEKNASELSGKKKEAKQKADVNASVTLENISAILTAQNFSMPAGYITDDNNNKYMVRVGDEVKDSKELKSLALFDTKIDGIGVVTLSDVADVVSADDSKEIYAKINGSDGIVLSFSKQSDIATSVVCDNINKTLGELTREFKGLRFTPLYSQGDYIEIVVNGVLQNLLSGAALAIIILLIFLRDIKPTLIVAISIPVSVIFAIVMMYFSGISLNMISLSGLAIGVGMLVDNSIVVIENIYRLRAKGYNAIQASLNGARQVAGAIAASTLTTICVFAPIVFVEGITRQIFSDMALTITYSLMASLIVALTLVPAMGQGMLNKIRQPKKQSEGRILKAYDKSIRFVLRHKVVAILAAVALLAGSGFAAFARGFSFMPQMSSTQIQVSVKLDDNATFEETVKEGEKLSGVLNSYSEFETVGVMAGNSMGAAIMGASVDRSDAGSLTAYGVLKSEESKNGTAVSEKLKNDLGDIKGEVTVSAGSMSSMSTLIGDGGVQMLLYGEDLKKLQKTAGDIAAEFEKLDGVDKADSGIGATSPEIKITVDKKKAAQKGLTVAQVFRQVAEKTAEEKTSTKLKAEGGKSLNVVVVKDNKNKVSADKVGSIQIEYTDAEGNTKKTSLSSIADISKSETMNTISRQNQKRTLTVSGTLKKGASLTNVTNSAKEIMKDYKLPSGFTYEFSGTDKQTMEAMQQLALMLLLGVILIYLIMVAQFQSLKAPFIIMFTIPLAFTGGFIGLLLTGFDVSVVSMIGFIMLCGIIVNNGIVLVDYINKLRLNGTQRTEAIVEAGKTRMRPIFITALTTVLGLSVMALGIGTGAEMMQPLAIVCIGGLLYATVMTLYIIPAIYDIFNRRELRRVEKEDLITIDD